jgi:hypothetical protein
MNELNRTNLIKLLLLELWSCIADAGISADRDAVDEFVEEMFDAST